MKCNCSCKCVACFRVLATKNRFKIFDYLRRNKGKKINLSSLVKLTRLRQPTVTFHLNQLIKRGLAKKHRVGREVNCYADKKCKDCPLF